VHDYVIVGAGSAGCVLAARLAEDPATRVCLLEAGPPARKLEIRVPAAFSKLFGSTVDWGYRTAPQPALDGREVLFPLGKVVGGSASVNAMMVLRGHRADHDAWPAGWSWQDVLPCYERSAAGPFPLDRSRAPHPLSEAFVAAAARTGMRVRDLNDPDNEGVGLVPTSTRRGRRFSVADGYLRPALRRPNLTLRTGAHAVSVLVESGRAVGVEVALDGRRDVVHAAREVVVCAGAIGSPALLLRSGIGPREELEALGIPCVADAPGVGKGLRDHLANGILVATDGAETLYSAERLRHLASWLVLRRGPLTSNVGEAAAFVRTDESLQAPDLELVFAPVLFENEGLSRPSQHGITIAAVLLRPRSVGEVRLRSPDPAVPPVVDPRYLSDAEGHDLRVLLHGIRLAREIAASEPLAPFVRDELLPGRAAQDGEALHAHVRAISQTLYHPVGTCRLGTDPTSVVDPELRVRRVDGLRVVDASVIPEPPRGHTNWPVVMVAERAADLVRAAAA
jgi:choline dehydrogenase